MLRIDIFGYLENAGSGYWVPGTETWVLKHGYGKGGNEGNGGVMENRGKGR